MKSMHTTRSLLHAHPGVVIRSLYPTFAGLCLAFALAGCGTTQGIPDETAGWSPEKLYAEAKDEASSGNFDKSAQYYERLEGRASGTLLAQQAQLERAFMLYRANEPAQALSILERFIRLNPSSPALDYALYLQGLLNFNDNLGMFGRISHQDLSERDQQASREAYLSFKQLVDRFPQSRYAPDALQRMNYIVNSLARYEVHVARYYYRRGAYLAAANRAQQTVQQFQNAPATEEALFLMASSYDKLGLNQLRDDAQRVLQKNFPKSSYTDLGNMGSQSKRWWKLF
jgi:outer membrane protein assembly factor BamD